MGTVSAPQEAEPNERIRHCVIEVTFRCCQQYFQLSAESSSFLSYTQAGQSSCFLVADTEVGVARSLVLAQLLLGRQDCCFKKGRSSPKSRYDQECCDTSHTSWSLQGTWREKQQADHSLFLVSNGKQQASIISGQKETKNVGLCCFSCCNLHNLSCDYDIICWIAPVC